MTPQQTKTNVLKQTNKKFRVNVKNFVREVIKTLRDRYW